MIKLIFVLLLKICCSRSSFFTLKIRQRNYIKKTTCQNWDENTIIKAVDAVRHDMPYKTVAKQYSVTFLAIKRRVKGNNVHAVWGAKLLGIITKYSQMNRS